MLSGRMANHGDDEIGNGRWPSRGHLFRRFPCDTAARPGEGRPCVRPMTGPPTWSSSPRPHQRPWQAQTQAAAPGSSIVIVGLARSPSRRVDPEAQ